MPGTINLALSQQFDAQGDPLSGGKLYFFVAGTTTPQNSFQDEALTIPQPNPIILDSSGRVPMFYLADGAIKIRLTDIDDVTIIAVDHLLVIGPSVPASALPTPPDPTAQLATGDIKARYGIGPLTGFVRCNGNSISKAGAGGTESASDLNQALFEYLWQFPNITLNTGKGGSANADWTFGRQLNLPDLRGRTIAGMDDMGATAASRLTGPFWGLNFSSAPATVIGNAGGGEKFFLTPGQIPNNTVAVTFPSNTVYAVHPTSLIPVQVAGNFDATVVTRVRSENFCVGTPAAGQTNSNLSIAVTSAQSTGSDSSICLSATPGYGSATWGVQENLFLGFFDQNVLTATAVVAGSGNTSLGNGAACATPSMVLTFYIKQ